MGPGGAVDVDPGRFPEGIGVVQGLEGPGVSHAATVGVDGCSFFRMGSEEGSKYVAGMLLYRERGRHSFKKFCTTVQYIHRKEPHKLPQFDAQSFP